MREGLKKRVAVLLTLLMVLPAIVAVLPMTAQDVQAASAFMSWNVAGYGSKKIMVEKGQQFYVGDYVNLYTYGKTSWYGTASLRNVSYSSSSASVASVNKKGFFTAKKTGSTKITVKYQGQKASCEFQVVAAGSLSGSDAASELSSSVSAMTVPSKVSAKNGFELRKQILACDAVVNEHMNDISYRGFLKEKSSGSSYYMETEKLAVPQAGRYMTLDALLNNYATQNSPTSTRSAKVMKIASASANSRAVTVKLKKSIDTVQILAAQLQEKTINAKVTGKSQAYIRVYMYNTKTYKTYYGLGLIRKGSRVMKITPQKYVYQNGGSYVNTKLPKGTYRLENKSYWTKGKTVTVK